MIYYFQKDAKHCYSKPYIESVLKADNIKQISVTEAAPLYGTRFFYCLWFNEVREVGPVCGYRCPEYQPINNKNGLCQLHQKQFAPLIKKVIIKNPDYVK